MTFHGEFPLSNFPQNLLLLNAIRCGIQWGDLGMGKQFRHAGLSAEAVEKIHPNELYAGQESEDDLQNHFHEHEPLLDGRGSGGDIAG
jgi:hypothetical protein